MHYGWQVILGGAQVKIRAAKFSVSSVPYDLAFDNYATVTVVESVAEQVSATERITPVADLVKSFGTVGDISVIYLEHSDVDTIKTRDGKSFDKMALTVCDASTDARFEVHIHGGRAHSAGVKLAEVAVGSPIVLRGVVFESVLTGWKAVLRKGGSVVLDAGVPEEQMLLVRHAISMLSCCVIVTLSCSRP